jgi:hypothetical protein
MRTQFESLFTPMNIGITGAALMAWGVSHFFGVGEAVDLGLAVVGALFLGASAFRAGYELGTFLEIAGTAESDAELDSAADHLAIAVTIIGVTAFVGLVMKAGARGAGIAGRAEFFGRSVEEWLSVLGRPMEPPLVRARLESALTFFRSRIPMKATEDIEGMLKGIDFSKPVSETTLDPGTEIVTYAKRVDARAPGDYRLGEYYTKPGSSTNRLGINDGKTVGLDGKPIEDPNTRHFVRLRINQQMTVLESRASEINDTWTVRGTRPLLKADNTPVLDKQGKPVEVPMKWSAGGGGVQYVIPNIRELIRLGVIDVIRGK